jgi:hypothetical protein
MHTNKIYWQASPKAVVFYERLGFKGDPCPQPKYPFFEIESIKIKSG